MRLRALRGKNCLPRVIVVGTAVLLALLSPGLIQTGQCQTGPYMYAHFIDMGQADATLLEFSCGAVLIDAGSQDDRYTDSLVAYISRFFQRRQDLNNTLDLILITHNHIDHTRALKAVVEAFTVRNYIDNGQLEGTGTANPNWVRKNAHSNGRDIAIEDIPDSRISHLPHKTGLKDAMIDPISCDDADPNIRVLSGRLDDNPGWSQEEFDNKNNQSIVTRVDFGESSFLFTGDLEEDAIATMLDWYDETSMLDVDVYHVGHHGSHNGTTPELVDAMSPDISMISCGHWDFGKDGGGSFTTYAYGHPRRVTVDLLSASILGKRADIVRPMIADGAKDFRRRTVKKRVYCTAWDGTVTIQADMRGAYVITRGK